MFSEGELVPLLHQEPSLLRKSIEKLLYHLEGLCIGYDECGGIPPEHLIDQGAVVRLHMVDDEIVELPPGEGVFHIFKVLAPDGLIATVEKRSLLIQDEIGIVAYAAVQRKEVLEEMKPPVLHADIDDVICYISGRMHFESPLRRFKLILTHAAERTDEVLGDVLP